MTGGSKGLDGSCGCARALLGLGGIRPNHERHPRVASDIPVCARTHARKHGVLLWCCDTANSPHPTHHQQSRTFNCSTTTSMPGCASLTWHCTERRCAPTGSFTNTWASVKPYMETLDHANAQAPVQTLCLISRPMEVAKQRALRSPKASQPLHTRTYLHICAYHHGLVFAVLVGCNVRGVNYHCCALVFLAPRCAALDVSAKLSTIGDAPCKQASKTPELAAHAG